MIKWPKPKEELLSKKWWNNRTQTFVSYFSYYKSNVNVRDLVTLPWQLKDAINC